MAFDGITIANIVKELNETIVGGKINKIAQPEADELILTIKNNRTQYRLLISASASLPLIYFTDKNKVSPLTAPNFCMLLRKHLQNGRIVNISQPGLERIVHIDIEHLDEMGDLRHKTLVMELMGKHSNLIFCNDDNTIIDSIKRVSAAVSSVREVLPGKPYFIAHTQDKLDALPSQLSGGQQQRTAIARALIYRPAILLADEPTGSLDRKNSREIIDLLKLSNRNLEQTILLITHDEKIALEADRIIAIEDGRIVSDRKRG